MGIDKGNMHILIGYDPVRGLKKDYRELIKENQEINICAYPDTRQNKSYLSSIRPHIIQKHLKAFPELQTETIFFHDSDIVFKTLPDFELMIHDQKWYASDTRSYLNSIYIKSIVDERIFIQMCDVIGVDKNLVERNDLNAGGAQYILKKTGLEFWEKVEKDGTALYEYLTLEDERPGYCSSEDERIKLQPWCSDMWALWWNAIIFQKQFVIHPELDFALSDSSISRLDKCRILHYTGSNDKNNDELFRKADYINHSPFHADLSRISPLYCGYYLKTLIRNYNQSQKQKRIDLSDVSFLILARIDSEDRQENILASAYNLSIYFNTNILIVEADNEPKLDITKLPDEVQYEFVLDNTQRLHHTKYINRIIAKSSTPYIAIYDADVILPVSQIVKSMELIRLNRYSAVSPYDGNFLNVDRLLKAMFINIQDANFLEENRNKLAAANKRSYGGAVFLNKDHYIESGLENENLSVWGPNDIERIKRLTNLGYQVKRIPGNLYHLHHSRGVNSGYQALEEKEELISEYLKICNLNRSDLLAYIQTWQWTINR